MLLLFFFFRVLLHIHLVNSKCIPYEEAKTCFFSAFVFLAILFGSLTLTYLHISNNLAYESPTSCLPRFSILIIRFFFQVECRVNWVPMGKRKTTVCQSTIVVKLNQIDKKIAVVRKSYVDHRFFLSFFLSLSLRMNSFKVVLTLVKSIQVSQITCGFFLLLHSLEYDFTYRVFCLNHHL